MRISRFAGRMTAQGLIAQGLIIALAVAIASRPAAAQGKAAQGSTLQPPELMMTVGIGPDSTLDNLRAFANVVQPGAGMVLAAQMLRRQIATMVTAASLDGLDEKGTTYVLAVDGGPALKGAAVVARVQNDAKLGQSVGSAHLIKKNGWAVLGPKAIAEKVAPFAFGTLAAQPPITGAPVVTLYTPSLMQRYKAEFEDVRKQFAAMSQSLNANQVGSAMQTYLDGLFSAIADSERAIVTFDITKDVAALDLALVPKSGSRLGKFVALQQPSDYALLGKLPAVAVPMLAAGRLDSGPYREGMLDAMMQMFGAAAPKNMASAYGAIMKATTGDFAMAMQMGTGQGVSYLGLFGVADAKAMDRAVGALLAGFKAPVSYTAMDMTTTITASKKLASHDGVALRGYDVTYDLSKMPAATKAMTEKMLPNGPMAGRVGTFDQFGVVALAADGQATAASIIDAARGKGKRMFLPAQTADFLAGSRARKESMVMLMDLAALAGAGATGSILMSLGFADKNAHLRIALPSSTVSTLAGRP